MILMKNLVYITFIILISSVYSNAQNTAKAESSTTEEVYKAENEGWIVSVDEAYVLSKQTGKPILANFTGSDWCGWCKRLTASVFVKDEFKTWAAQNVILLELDFPNKKKVPVEIQQQNAGMAQAFGVKGYPTIRVFYLDKDEEKNQFSVRDLGQTGYKATPTEFINDVKQMLENGKP